MRQSLAISRSSFTADAVGIVSASISTRLRTSACVDGLHASGALGADGVTLQQFNEGAGGQVVFHLHVHVIPRKTGVAMKPPASEKEKPEVLAEQAKKLAAAIAAL